MTHNKHMVPISSNEIIGPDRFGPSLWQGLHYITLGYPIKPTEEQKQKYKAFFLLLKDTLPCKICADHFAENLKKLPITDTVLETRENLVKWLIDFHNIVNESKGKPIIEYKIARKMIDTDMPCKSNLIEKFSNESMDNNYNIKFIYGLVGILITLLLISMVYKKN